MTASVEIALDELEAHAFAIAVAKTKEEFVTAFSSYVRDVVTRETDPYEKIALFVHGMVGSQREVIRELMQLRGGGAA